MGMIENSIIAFLVCFGIGIIFYPLFIKYLNKKLILQIVSEYATEEFKNKPKVPIFGGVLFILLTIIATVISNFLLNSHSAEVYVFLFTLFIYFLIGFVDDYRIVKYSKNDGLKEKHKFLLQILAAALIFVVFNNKLSVTLFGVSLPWIIVILFGCFMLAGFSNAVNITDGIDGLSSSTVSLSFFIWWLIIIFSGKHSELLIPISCLVGGLIAYFVYNVKPAKIYMGDCGSLALGAGFMIIGFILDLSLLAVLIGIVFVLETLSVMIQIFSVKVFKKKVFLYTPIHYTFTLKGYSENQVVLLFNLVGVIGGVLALMLRIWFKL